MKIKLWDGKSELQHGDWVGFQEFVCTVEDWAVGFFIGKDSGGWSTFEILGSDEEYDAWLGEHYASPTSIYKVTTVEAVRNAQAIASGESE